MSAAGYRDEMILDDGGRVVFRPMRAEDAEEEKRFMRDLSVRSRYLRFHSVLRELTPAMLKRFTQPSYPDEMALVAWALPGDGSERQIAVARWARIGDSNTGEVAIVVADDWQGRGIGGRLLGDLVGLAREAGYEALEVRALAENRHMIDLAHRAGFSRVPSGDFRVACLRRSL